jgi:hypothetical protein
VDHRCRPGWDGLILQAFLCKRLKSNVFIIDLLNQGTGRWILSVIRRKGSQITGKHTTAGYFGLPTDGRWKDVQHVPFFEGCALDVAQSNTIQ